MIDLIALSAAKKHADLLAMGLTSVSVDNTNKSITFTLTADGSQHTIYFDQPSDGVSIIGVEIKNGHLICLMSDGSEIDAGVLPSGSGSGGSIPKPPVGAQSDWNQNDDTQPDYVKNRPFYTGDPVETVLVEESTVLFADNSGKYMGQLESTFSATVGETYKVSWDGAVYESACVDLNGMTLIGNLALMAPESDTGEPFVMMVENGKRIRIGTADTSASHTISISGYNESVVKINPKYLPMASETEPGIVTVDDLANDVLELVTNKYFTPTGFQVSGYRDADTIQKCADTNNSYSISIPGKLGGAVLSYYNNSENKYITSVLSGGEYINCYKFSLGSLSEEQLWGISKDGVVISSSTANSTKKFKITVDDTGTLSATEVT